jgi:hypothetical protein
MQPQRLDLTVWKNVPARFTIEDVTVDGTAADFTGMDGRRQVRLYQGATGDPLIDVSTFDTTQGEVSFPSSDSVEIFIEQSALDDLPANGGETGSNDPDVFAYDIVIGGENAVFFYGDFKVYRGVTQ